MKKINVNLRKSYFTLGFILLVFLGFGCKEDPDTPDNVTDYSQGVFILNEGNFNGGNASLSHRSNENELTEGVFHVKNERPLGDVFQSMTVVNNKGFLVVNNSDKIEVVDMDDFHSLQTITSIAQPRYLLEVSTTKAYVSSWSGNGVSVLNLENYERVGEVNTGAGPNQMLKVDGKVYIANSGGFGVDSTIAVVDPLTDTVIATIQVGYNPSTLQLDKFGKIWVVCSGRWAYGPTSALPGSLYRIDPMSGMVDFSLVLTDNDHPSVATMNQSGDRLLYMNSGLYSMNVSNPFSAGELLTTKNYYGLGVHPVSGKIYGADPVDYSQNGWVYIMDESGMREDSFQVGIIPNGFYFVE